MTAAGNNKRLTGLQLHFTNAKHVLVEYERNLQDEVVENHLGTSDKRVSLCSIVLRRKILTLNVLCRRYSIVDAHVKLTLDVTKQDMRHLRSQHDPIG